MPNEESKEEAAENIEIVDEAPEAELEAPESTEETKPGNTEESKQDSAKPAKHSEKPKSKKASSKIKRLWTAVRLHKKISLPIIALVLLCILLLVPFTRYSIFGLFWKQMYTVKVVDSQTKQPVTAATVMLAGREVATNNQGLATIRVRVGHDALVISKKYYAGLSEKVLVPLRKPGTQTFALKATGRQVPVIVTNKINGVPVSDAIIKAFGTRSRTDKNGKAIVVLPAGQSTAAATLSASGYNDLSIAITITAQSVPANAFKLTPSGKIYFLSNASGNIDVVSTNLDGTNRQTVLAGTGNEDPNNTSLLASRDWKYLALNAKRDTSQNSSSIYLINTATDKLTTMDTGDADFNPIGWDNHYFIYTVDRSATVADWQSGQYALKSYDADTGRIASLDQTTGQNVPNTYNSYTDTTFAFVNIVGSKVVYGFAWTASGVNAELNGKFNIIISVNADGTGKEALQNIALPAFSWYSGLYAVPVSPSVLYIQSTPQQGPTTYYTYDNGGVGQSTTINDNSFIQAEQSAKAYLVSPSGSQTFWAEPRDGKNTLFVGDQNGNNPKQIAVLSDYTPYGWYTNNYLLVEKDGSELYIMPVSGKGQPLKISDYYKAAEDFNGYGGGYGGL